MGRCKRIFIYLQLLFGENREETQMAVIPKAKEEQVNDISVNLNSI